MVPTRTCCALNHQVPEGEFFEVMKVPTSNMPCQRNALFPAQIQYLLLAQPGFLTVQIPCLLATFAQLHTCFHALYDGDTTSNPCRWQCNIP
jgi:hypothetical protein